tara:strand:- start:1460 stop:1633 length:174 start_codon:yes stop_codon:yes gene_type:complete
MVKRNMIKCSQCDAEFPSGVEYRDHWEEKHFYPYLKNGGFNHEKALSEKESLKIYNK